MTGMRELLEQASEMLRRVEWDGSLATEQCLDLIDRLDEAASLLKPDIQPDTATGTTDATAQ